MWTLTFFALAIVLWLIYRKRSFSVLKEMGIPGPKPNILFGNLLEMITKSPLKCQGEWLKKYGNILGYYVGTLPVIVVADIDLLKKMQISDFQKFINRPTLFFGVEDRKDKKSPRIEGFSESLIRLRDKRWKEIRSIITPSFTASKMKQMAPIINGAIDSMVNNVEKKCSTGESFDVYPMFEGLTTDIIGRTAFGIQSDAQNNPDDVLLRALKVFFSFERDIHNSVILFTLSFRSFNTLWNWLSRLRLTFQNRDANPTKELTDSVKAVIATRRKNKENRRSDLLQLMIDAEIDESSAITSDDLTAKGGDSENKEQEKTKNTSSGKLMRKMTDAEILDNAVLFFLAGYETTSTALAFTTHFLVQNPEAQERVRREVQQLLEDEGELDYYSVNKLQYLDQVLHESLRLYPPVGLFISRECGEDVDLGTIKLKEGLAVQVPAYYIQRDPELWGPDANEFKPERFSPENKSNIQPVAFQAFGQGPRNCVGMRFAFMEAKLTLARLLSKFSFKACSQTEKDPLELKVSFGTINPKRGIWTKAVPV